MQKRHIEGILQVVTPLHVAGETGDKNTIYTTRMDIFPEEGRSGLPYFPATIYAGVCAARRPTASWMWSNPSRCTSSMA